MESLRDVTCKKCRVLLLKVEVPFEGAMEIKCRKCKYINKFYFTTSENDGEFSVNGDIVYI